MNIKKTMLASSVLMIIATASHAELYISPIVNDTSSVTIVDDAPKPFASVGSPSVQSSQPLAAPQSTSGFKVTTYGGPVGSRGGVPASPSPAPSGALVVAAVPVVPAPVVIKKAPGLFGRSVPLRIASNNLVPNKNWIVNIEDGLENKKVSWSDAANFEEAFSQIGRNAGLKVVVNKNESAVGIAFSAELANNLAKRSPNIYKINESVSLRKNLEAWAAKANWTVVYQSGLTADYDGLNAATLTVPFEGPGGAADILLKSTWNKNVALMGRFKTGNRTLYVEERGFDRSNKLTPTE